MIIKDRYNLTLKENIFLAKKTIVETIYNSAKLEGLHVTFPDSQLKRRTFQILIVYCHASIVLMKKTI